MRVVLDIVKYERQKVETASRIMIIGVCILISAVFLDQLQWLQIATSITGIVLMIYALAVSKYFDLKMLKIGSVEINEETTTIIRCGQKTDYINKTISFRYNNLRFKGSHNYIPFLTLGSFTTHTGLNTISLDNGHETISLDIIIKNELELNRLKQLATRFYK